MEFTIDNLRGMRVGVLLGGRSSERDISLRSGEAVAGALESQGLDVVRIDVDLDVAQRLLSERVQVAFIALHGRWGEDGSIQGLLESLAIPYTGSGVASSAVAMDKVLSKRLFESAGIPVAPWMVLGSGVVDPSSIPFGFPCVVKPSREGSSVGVHVVREPGGLAAAVDDARTHAGEVLVERFVKGREINAAVLGDRAIGAIEIVPASGFYDFNAKYVSGTTRYLFPAPLPEDQYAEACELALKSHRALGCDGATRTDLILGEDGRFVVLEVNTLPGMTATSLLPKIAAGVGVGFEELCLQILSEASLKA